jgi:hypothetical protein
MYDVYAIIIITQNANVHNQDVICSDTPARFFFASTLPSPVHVESPSVVAPPCLRNPV